jgi:drug/metabolite transporter (DMT)-like permease
MLAFCPTFLLALWARIPQHGQAILWMVSAAFWFSCMAGLVRYLAMTGLDFATIVLYRNGIALGLMLPWAYRQMRTARWAMWQGVPWKGYAARGCNGFISMLLWFWALQHMPLPEAVSLSFTTPLFTALGAVLWFNERMTRLQWGVFALGISGVLVILRPGFAGTPTHAYGLVLLSSLMWAVSNLLIKRLSRTRSPQEIVFFMTLWMTPLSLLLTCWWYTPPVGIQWLGLCAIGIVSNLAQGGVSRAYGMAEMALVQPFDFCRLIFAALIGSVAFGEHLSLRTLLGACIIASSALAIAHLRTRAQRRER